MKPVSIIGILLLFAAGTQAELLGTSVTFQGSLSQGGSPANGAFDMQFRIFDVASDGIEIVPSVSLDEVQVQDGIFSVDLDFGVDPFMGEQLWLEVRVRPGADTGGFTQLLPRQKITAAPYALHAEMVAVDSVTGVEVVDGSINAADINPSQVQRRVTGACTSEAFIRIINSDGSVTCESDSLGTLLMNNETQAFGGSTATTPACSSGYRLTGGGCLCSDPGTLAVKQTLTESRPDSIIGGDAWVCSCSGGDLASAVAYCARVN